MTPAGATAAYVSACRVGSGGWFSPPFGQDFMITQGAGDLAGSPRPTWRTLLLQIVRLPLTIHVRHQPDEDRCRLGTLDEPGAVTPGFISMKAGAALDGSRRRPAIYDPSVLNTRGLAQGTDGGVTGAACGHSFCTHSGHRQIALSEACPPPRLAAAKPPAPVRRDATWRGGRAGRADSAQANYLGNVLRPERRRRCCCSTA